jgi:hypothetical protein
MINGIRTLRTPSRHKLDEYLAVREQYKTTKHWMAIPVVVGQADVKSRLVFRLFV